jgi:O-antigen ligase
MSCVALTAVGLLLTFSRAALLAVVAVYLGLALRRNRRWFWILLAAMVLAVAALPYARQRVIETVASPNWSSGRAQIWRLALDRLTDRPLHGYGLNSFKAIVGDEARLALPDSGVGDWHNQYLQIYMETGLAGLLLFGYLLYELLRALWGSAISARSQHRSDDRAVGGLCLLTGFMLIGLFEQFLSSPAIGISFWLGCLSCIVF